MFSFEFLCFCFCFIKLFVLCFSLSCFVCFMCLYVLLFSPSLFKLLHLQSKKTHIKTEKTEKLEGKHKKNRKNRNLPARPLEIFIFRGGSWAGYPVFLFVFYVFLRVFLFLFLFLSVFFCFRLVFLSFCIYNRKNTYKNKKKHKNSKENIKKQKKPKSPSQTLRDIYFSRRFVGWISCIVCFCLNVVLV